MERVCVYCGASRGRDPGLRRGGARDGARARRARPSSLVTGGGRVGLMGVVADAALEAGGRVIGVIRRR